jgi:hypothetical protein
MGATTAARLTFEPGWRWSELRAARHAMSALSTPAGWPSSTRTAPRSRSVRAALIAEMAVEQADQYIKTGKASEPEKQSIDCELITKANADEYGVFARLD